LIVPGGLAEKKKKNQRREGKLVPKEAFHIITKTSFLRGKGGSIFSTQGGEVKEKEKNGATVKGKSLREKKKSRKRGIHRKKTQNWKKMGQRYGRWGNAGKRSKKLKEFTGGKTFPQKKIYPPRTANDGKGLMGNRNGQRGEKSHK